MRGRVNPKVMASAVAPFAAMSVSRFTGVRPPMETNSTRALAASKRKKPGIIEATAEKASAAKGRCRRSAEADHEHADAGVDPASDAKRDPRAYEINRAVEKMRTRHQHHARTECNESVKCSVDTGGKFPAN